MRTLILTTLLLIVVPLAVLFVGTKTDGRSESNPGGASWAPGLALDLEGGTQLILTPIPEVAGSVTSATISQAIDVIRQRVDASGVAEAEITSQGTGASAKIVVSLPGNPDEATLALVRTSAQMEFRPVLVQSYVPTAAATPTASPTPTPTATQPAEPSSPSDASYYVTPEVQQEFDALDCTDPANRVGGVNGDPDKAFVTCYADGSSKLILGPVEIKGENISSATSGLQQLPNGTTGSEWVVNLEFDSQGTSIFADTTERLLNLGKTEGAPKDQFAVVLDGLVITAPQVNSIIPNGQAEISGSFNRASAASLANQLSFGSLPVSFQVESEQQISATLGSEQLQRGLIAGLIGLVLVFIYSLFQYRALGFLTIGSLLVAGVITYAFIALLSWGMGYRLSLAGVAGLIVAIGFTADSFIVYFERIRDELRDGRNLGGAVERGWVRARRTILAAKGVNLVSAVVLYYLAVGGVQGFAFTLGLTTVIDVAVVFWFTHPMMEVISRIGFFRDGHRWSGLSPERLRSSGIRYVGAGRFQMPQDEARSGPEPQAQPDPVPETVAVGAPRAQAPRDGMTIAERRAAARAKGATAAPAHPADGDENEESR